MTDVNVVDTLE